MPMSLHFVLLFTVIAFSAGAAQAQDCGWSSLTEGERADLQAGKSVARAKFNEDGIHFEINQWGFSGNSSLDSSVASFYDLRGRDFGVAEITLSDGQKPGNNPVLWDGVPKAHNPFGHLYQPFTFAESVKRDGDGYRVIVNYLSSPGLVEHVYNDVCFAVVNEKVLIGFFSTVVGNPRVPLNHRLFGRDAREILWKNVFAKDVARASEPASEEQLGNLREALSQVRE